MADTVTTTILHDGPRKAVMRFTNASDGTGESDVVKVDVSTLATLNGAVCTEVAIDKIWYSTSGMSVVIEWDATTDVLAIGLQADRTDCLDMKCFGGLTNNAGAGKTGDILFTTAGHTSGDSYMVVLEMTKTY